MIDGASRAIARRRREHRAALMRQRWADPEYRARQCGARSARMKRAWADPVEGARRRAKLAALNRSDMQRKRVGARMVKRLADPEFKAKLSRTMKALHRRPEIQRRTIEHARANLRKINARRRATRNFVPAGKMKLYRKLRAAGIDRKEALRQCWMSA